MRKCFFTILLVLSMPFMYVSADTEVVQDELVNDAEIINTEEVNVQEVKYVASIGDVMYESLNDAIKAASSTDVINLLDDVNESSFIVSSTVVINGNGKKIDTNYLEVTGNLTIKNTVLNITATGNNSILMNNYGAEFNVLEGSKVTATNKGILSVYDITINVDNSTFTLKDISYVAWMQGQERYKYATLNVTNGATFRISNVIRNEQGIGGNGLNWVNTNVINSKIFIEDCEYQGIVAGSLVLKNSSALFSGNGYAHTLYRGEEITVDGKSSYDITETKMTGIWSWGGKITFKNGSKVNLTNNGNSKSNESDEDVTIVSTGLNSSVIYLTSKTRSSLEIEDGAIVNITDNYMRALANNGTAYIGNTTNIMNNGMVNPNYGKISAVYGGGIFNSGILTIAEGVNIYNNHAEVAADDIYNAEGAIIDFKDVKDNWILDDCDDKINNWYDDSENNRWNAHSDKEEELHVDDVKSGKYETGFSIKAAHNLKAKVIARYVDQDGNVLAEEEVINGYVNDEYKTVLKDIYGYELNHVEGEETGKMTIKDIIVTYVYEYVMGEGGDDTPEKPDVPDVPEIPYTGVEEDICEYGSLTTMSITSLAYLVLIRKKFN